MKPFKKYIEYDVYAVTPIKQGYGFRVKLTFSDESTTVQQHSGFKSKRAANVARDEVVGQLHSNTYIVYDKLKVADFMEYWLETVMRPRITANTYNTYKNVVYRYVIPKLGGLHMSVLNQGHIRRLYNEIAKISENVVRVTKTVMNTSLKYAKEKNILMINPVNGVMLPKKVKKKGYRERAINVQKTLTMEEVQQLIEGSKGTAIHMQILFAVLMGLRCGEINGLKYSDVDYINRTLTVERQLGKLPNVDADAVPPKMVTKQEIPTKTLTSNRVLPIPDYVFEAILEQRKCYEANRRRRSSQFQDLDYICCSSYGRPRGKSFHFQPYKALLRELGLPDITFHDLRNTYTTLLLKNNYDVKAVSCLLGHAKEIITADVYGDTQAIIEDCLYAMEPFMDEVLPVITLEEYCDFSDMEELEWAAVEYLAA